MLELKKGVDILTEVGGITAIDQAWELFRKSMRPDQLAKIERISNEEALLRIANAIAMCRPDDVFINTGSPADMRTVRQMALDKGEEAPLAMPDHTIHFDLGHRVLLAQLPPQPQRGLAACSQNRFKPGCFSVGVSC